MPAASHFILYVADQERAAQFYAAVLRCQARRHVPGMTEFDLPGGALQVFPVATETTVFGTSGFHSIELSSTDPLNLGFTNNPGRLLHVVVDNLADFALAAGQPLLT